METEVIGSSLNGYSANLVKVETNLSNNLPTISIVGLGNKAVDESKERVRSAVTNSGLQIPRKKITINLAPADLPKQGSALDLAIAVAILSASKQLPAGSTTNTIFIGELSLDGRIRGINGILGHIMAARNAKYKTIIIPAENSQQAALSQGIEIIAVSSLKQLYNYLCKDVVIKPIETTNIEKCRQRHAIKLSDIAGQTIAKRAMAIAVAGRHNVLLGGPPGTGKTMLARTAPSLMPPLKKDEIHALTHLYSLANDTSKIIRCRPFRSPHHTASNISLVGGGRSPTPGEISLAHHGVLFLDEILEFSRHTLETLRQPLEDGEISIVRTESKATYPANFMLIGALNPCPCGYLGDSRRECSCTPNTIQAYQKRLSGPLLDRFDLQVSVDRPKLQDLSSKTKPIEPSNIPRLIIVAWRKQLVRNPKSKSNSRLSLKEIEALHVIDIQLKRYLTRTADKLALSMRGYLRVLRVALTIADIDGSPTINKQHILEALFYRQQSLINVST